MAVTILQQPSYPNGGYTNLVYAISGSNSRLPQYQYVMDFKSSTGQLLTRVRQYPNPAGSAIFDVGDISTDYLDYDEVFTLVGVSGSSSNVKTFQIAFGEEYGTSISSSVTIYNGKGSVGNPAVTGSTPIIYPVVVEPESGTYNWPSGSFVQGTPLTTQQTFAYSTNGVNQAQAKPVYLQTQYETLSVMNNLPTTSLSSVVVTLYNSSGGVIKTGTLPGTYASKYLVHAGVGPANLAGIDAGWAAVINGAPFRNIATYKVDFNYTSPSRTRTFWYKREECAIAGYPITTFAFVNVLGVYDYFTINLPFKKNTRVHRNTYEKPFLDYSKRTAPYNRYNRGDVQYYTSYDDTYELQTDWLEAGQSYWLAQLIESPSVFASIADPDYGGEAPLSPILLTNSSYDWYTNIRGQKLFQYNLQFKFANSRRSRKG